MIAGCLLSVAGCKSESTTATTRSEPTAAKPVPSEPAAKPAPSEPAARPAPASANADTFPELGIQVDLPPDAVAIHKQFNADRRLDLVFGSMADPPVHDIDRSAYQAEGLFCSKAGADKSPASKTGHRVFEESADGWGLIDSNKYKHNQPDLTIECYRAAANVHCTGTLLGHTPDEESDKAEKTMFDKQLADARQMLAVCKTIRPI
jgi:hypothetical protein